MSIKRYAKQCWWVQKKMYLSGFHWRALGINREYVLYLQIVKIEKPRISHKAWDLKHPLGIGIYLQPLPPKVT